MSEEKTFRHLKRIPYDEMTKKIRDFNNDSMGKVPHMYRLGNFAVERTTYYDPTIVRHHGLVRLLEIGGWTLDEYAHEMEKQAVIQQVKEFNENLEFPTEIIERAKQFFPDIKFTEAKLELE
jgi:hypothetical protein